jgi:hypothetical protein
VKTPVTNGFDVSELLMRLSKITIILPLTLKETKKTQLRGVVNYETNSGLVEICKTLVIYCLESHVIKHKILGLMKVQLY